jgi:hypothetical protein
VTGLLSVEHCRAAQHHLPLSASGAVRGGCQPD